MKDIILCITFGHASAQVRLALQGAVAYASENPDTLVLAVDDCSGNAPSDIGGVTVSETPSRRGFAGVVSYVVGLHPKFSGRLLLINPDASLAKESVGALLSVESGMAVPRVLDSRGMLENVRRATTGGEQLCALLFGEGVTRRSIATLGQETQTVQCPPFAPSGSVLSVPLDYLRSVPLRDEFFWLEQSDWVYRYSQRAGAFEISVLPSVATHTGASTSLRYPVSVAASQLQSKVNFITEYGHAWFRLLIPLAVLLRSIRFSVRTRSLTNGIFLVKVVMGKADWRVNR